MHVWYGPTGLRKLLFVWHLFSFYSSEGIISIYLQTDWWIFLCHLCSAIDLFSEFFLSYIVLSKIFPWFSSFYFWTSTFPFICVYLPLSHRTWNNVFDNSNKWVISRLVSIGSLARRISEPLLVLCMLNNSGVCPGHFEY